MLSLLSKSCCNVFSHSVDESDQLCIGFQPDASFVDFGTILFACLHHMLPQLSFFLCFCLSYLFLWEQICSRFHAGGRKRRPNVALSCFSLFRAIVFLCSWCMVITFCVSRRRRRMYCGHARLCVCLSVCVSVCLFVRCRMPHYCTDPDVTWGSGRGCPLVVHY